MPRPKTHIVTLTDSEREQFTSIAKNYRYSQLERNRAQILLLTEQGLTDAQVAQKAGCSWMTIRNVRLRFCKSQPVDESQPARQRIKRAEQHNRPKRAFDGEKEAHLIAITCSTPPEGASRWTLQLLHDRVIEMGILEKVGKETIRRTLKKMNSNPG
jgi:DNA-binding CsgD family transcriptional regulator